MAYKKNHNLHRKRVRSRRLVLGSFMALLIGLFATGIIFIDRLINENESSRIVGTGVQAKVESSTINIFRTPFFQFQASRDWREITEETTESKFVYRGLKGGLVEHQFVVQVDNAEETQIDRSVTRAYPFEVIDNRISPIADISEHCGDFEDDLPNKLIRQVYENTEFNCVVDGASYVVSLTEAGGNEYFKHTGQDGVERTFKITYQNSTFTPSGSTLRSIIKTFLLL